MKFTTVDLFASPVWTFDLDQAEQLNTMLVMDGQNFTQASQHAKLNYIDFEGYGISQLRDHMLAAIDSIAQQRGWSNYVPEIRARQNVLQPLECDTPHHHPDADLIAVYYVTCPELSGELLIHDPRGSVGAIWQDPSVVNDANGRSGRIFCRIQPRPGLLVMFPNYLFHSVETNLSNKTRIFIVSNIRLHMDEINEYV